jgi:glycine cleavage system H protein
VVPEELNYTREHEWVRRIDLAVVRIGITDYAQRQLGDVVFVQLPDIGTQVGAGQALGEVESTKSVSDIYAPAAGQVTACNDGLVQQPELINTDPYGEGWMIEIRLADPSTVDTLLDAPAYHELTEQS